MPRSPTGISTAGEIRAAQSIYWCFFFFFDGVEPGDSWARRPPDAIRAATVASCFCFSAAASSGVRTRRTMGPVHLVGQGRQFASSSFFLRMVNVGRSPSLSKV